MIRPVPGPWRVPPPFRARYVHTGETVTWTSRCDCGSGQPVAWTAARDVSQPTCTCTCDAQEGPA